MFSSSVKVLLLLLPLVALPLFFSCSREGSEPVWEPQSHLGSKDYHGGLFPVWITLKEPMANANLIKWQTKHAYEAYRKQGLNEKRQVIADTAFLFWETLPPMRIDTIETRVDTNTVLKFDTTYHDTVFAIVDGLASQPIIVEIKNILPRLKKFSVNGLEQPIDSLLTVAVHPNGHIKISILLENSLNKTFHPVVTMPKEMKDLRRLSEESKGDTLLVYEWKVPEPPPQSEIYADTVYLKVEDSGGRGERFYKVHLVIYMEAGSVWIASAKELVKYSKSGLEVARMSDDFISVSDIAVNSNDGKLFVADEFGNFVAIYDYYGKRLYKSTDMFNMPTGIAIDVESNYVWVADVEESKDEEGAIVSKAKVSRFLFTGDNNLSPINARTYNMPYNVKGLSIDQFKKDFVWFAIPEIDTVGFVRSLATEPTYILNKNWQRPSMVDFKNGIAWVADSARVVAVSESEKTMAIISGFDFVSSVSSCKDYVWISDIDAKKVYRFQGPFSGNNWDLNLTTAQGLEISGFSGPISVSASNTDCSVWVVDREAAKAVLLDSSGKIIASGTGLSRPNLGKMLQIVE
jgi:hypothetical protein